MATTPVRKFALKSRSQSVHRTRDAGQGPCSRDGLDLDPEQLLSDMASDDAQDEHFVPHPTHVPATSHRGEGAVPRHAR
eukprot:3830569-Karenia_brevis.AAC.1